MLFGAALILAAALVWRFTPLHEVLTPQHLAQRLESFEAYRWSPLILIGAYVVGGLVVFPVTLLSATVALTLPPMKAVPVALSGALSSAALLYWIGARLLQGRLDKVLGPTLERLEHALSDRGIVTIATIRMTPIAPFTLINIAAGAMGVRFRDYLLGTLLGFAPGLTMLALFGNRVRTLWKNPDAHSVTLVMLVGLAWIGVVLGLQRWASRRRKRR